MELAPDGAPLPTNPDWEAYGKQRWPKIVRKAAEWGAKKSPVCRLWFRRGREVPGTGERLVELERARIGQTLLSLIPETVATLTYVGRASKISPRHGTSRLSMR